jgi:amidase
MADLSGLPRSHDRRKVAGGAGLIGAALLALTLGGCISVEVRTVETAAPPPAPWPVEAPRFLNDVAAPSGLTIVEVLTFATDADRRRAVTSTALAEVARVDRGMPDRAPNSVLRLSDDALAQAVRARGGETLSGVPILLKDNIETADMPTTAGSLALANNAPGRDAPIVARLRDAGAVILGKTNLSEWANIRSSQSISGWSAVGGQTRNSYDPARTPCGSSSGSAVAVAAGLAPAAIGTETDGSITCPASVTGIVGFKPTVGLVSRTHIVPISHSQDTAGPMTRTVEDAAIVLSVIAGTDPLDAATAEADARKVDYRAALDAGSLRGARIGVMRFLLPSYSEETQAEFARTLAVLEAAGAVLVDIEQGPDLATIGRLEFTVLMVELKHDLNLYLAATDPTQVKTRTLAEVIAFNAAEPRETVLFGQELFVLAEATRGLDDPEYVAARADSAELTLEMAAVMELAVALA